MPRPGRPGTTYVGVDLMEHDARRLREIADADGHRPVASLLRSIVSEWIRRHDAGVSVAPSMPPVMTFPQPSPARPSIVLGPPEYVTAEELPSNEASDKPGEDN
jgi:hypothetical protein